MAVNNFYNTAAVAVLMLCFRTGVSDIVIVPSSREVQLGGSTFFNCSTSITSKEIHWFHYPVASTDRSFVYSFGKFYDRYMGRFALGGNATSGQYNLVITCVVDEDAGKYECQDDAGSGSKKSAQLIFLDVGLVCRSNVNTMKVIGPNSCNIEPDQLILLTCMVQYKGNEAPILQWGLNDTKTNITDGVTHKINDNRVVYNLTLTTNQISDGSFYECRTTRSSSKISCTSGGIKVVGSNQEQEMSNGESCSCNSYKIAIACICLLLLLPLSIGVIVLYLKPKCNWIPGITGYLCTCLPSSNESIKKSDDFENQKPTLTPAEAQLNPGTSGTDEKLTQDAEAKKHLIPDLPDEPNKGVKSKIKTLDNEVINLKQTQAEDRRTISDLRQMEKSNKGAIETLEFKNKQLQAEVKNYDQLILQGQDKVKELEQHLYPKESIDYLEKPDLAYTIQLSESSKGRSIRGMTILGKELFVVTEGSQDIEVYDSKTFQHELPWKVEELTNPLDIASSEINDCLYIIDKRGSVNEAEIMRLRPRGEVLKQWLFGGVGLLGRLSTNGSNVIICLSDKQLIHEYSPDGMLILTVALSPAVGINNPLHAVKVTSTCFVVSHGDAKDELHRVCVVDSDGKIKRECTKWEKSKILSRSTMKVPICLVEDKERSIIVADRDNNRILLLSSLLKHQRKLIDLEQISKGSPVRLCFDDTQSKLFIAVNRWSSSRKEWDDRHILIFNVK